MLLAVVLHTSILTLAIPTSPLLLQKPTNSKNAFLAKVWEKTPAQVQKAFGKGQQIGKSGDSLGYRYESAQLRKAYPDLVSFEIIFKAGKSRSVSAYFTGVDPYMACTALNLKTQRLEGPYVPDTYSAALEGWDYVKRPEDFNKGLKSKTRVNLTVWLTTLESEMEFIADKVGRLEHWYYLPDFQYPNLKELSISAIIRRDDSGKVTKFATVEFEHK